MLHKEQHHQRSDPQSGMVLLLCLIFLTALTLLGLSASADAILQHQLAANLQETERARQSAQAALEWAEDWLLELDSPPPRNCNAFCEGVLIHATGSLPRSPEFERLSWWTQTAHEAGIDPLSGEHLVSFAPDRIGAPLWMIESLHETSPDADSSQVWYRILVRGAGRTEAGVSVIEGVLAKRWALSSNTETASADPCVETGPGATCGRLSWRELR